MFKVYLTVNPVTNCALYDDQRKFLGIFDSIPEAISQLGRDMVDRFCSIYTA